jgi:hypothetical protein
MSRSLLQVLGLGLGFGILLGCEPVRDHARETSRQIKTTSDNVKKNLRDIQQHGEVDLEVMAQLKAVQEAYRNHLDTRSSPPASWIDLESTARAPGSVQEARRNGAFVRFGTTAEDLADEQRRGEAFAALTSPSDGSHWALRFDGTVAPLSDAEFEALSQHR